MTTWQFSRTSLLMRWYLWFYKASPENVTFCSFAWGLLLSPILLPFRLLGKSLAPMVSRWLDKLMERSMRKENAKGTWEQRHPRLTRVAGVFASPWVARVLLVLLLPFAAYGCYNDLWNIVIWIPYYLIFGSLYFGFGKTAAWRFLKDAYHSLKDRSCPRIEVD